MSKANVMKDALKAQKQLDKVDAKEKKAVADAADKAKLARQEIRDSLSPEALNILDTVSLA